MSTTSPDTDYSSLPGFSLLPLNAEALLREAPGKQQALWFIGYWLANFRLTDLLELAEQTPLITSSEEYRPFCEGVMYALAKLPDEGE